MASLTLSDLSRAFQMRKDTVQVRSDLARASHELASGKPHDLGTALQGNFGPLAALDRQLSSLSAFETTAQEMAIFADTAQLALGRVNDVSEELGTRMIVLTPADLKAVGGVIADEARTAFEASVNALNSTAAGRSIFGGTATDRPPLAAAQTMLDELSALVAVETTAAGAAGAIDAWFAPGGGFEATGYLGSADPLANVQVAERREVAIGLKADDPVVRDQLKGLAMAALLDSTGVASADEKAAYLSFAGDAIVANRDRWLRAQAAVGSTQSRIETAIVQNGAERTALQIARSEMISIDPYQVATELQNLEAQLQTIYTLTARLSGLSLTNYLR